MNVYNSCREICEFEMRVVRALNMCCFFSILQCIDSQKVVESKEKFELNLR